MHILLIKTSSMGDIIHTLPALTEACAAIPQLECDWVIEEAFAEIPRWHPGVKRVIPIAWRQWRQQLHTISAWRAVCLFWHQLRKEHYDYILDAQGLMKSALLARIARGKRCGLDWNSAREKYATYCYQEHYAVNFLQHAITRMRLLLSQVLNYQMTSEQHPDYGIVVPTQQQTSDPQENATLTKIPSLVFLHGTSWETKQWPEAYWIALAQFAQLAGYEVTMTGGNTSEINRATRIAKAAHNVTVLAPSSLSQLAVLLTKAHAVVAVDTGLAHLAAALNVPTISLYGPTEPTYTGVIGKTTREFRANFPCAPCLKRRCTYLGPSNVTPACFSTLSPEAVWASIAELLLRKK